jgi:hypothetical protein
MYRKKIKGGQYFRKQVVVVFLKIVWGWMSHSKTISSAHAKNTIGDNWKDQRIAQIQCSSKRSTDPSHKETYRVRLGGIRFHPLGPGVLGRGISLLPIPTFLLISGFVEYHCESISGSWVVHIPFTKLRQGAT